ncbi:MAG: ribosomal L7Ae/L30e/S12e/Gadd45 family protein [Synergistaceae bacterium]
MSLSELACENRLVGTNSVIKYLKVNKIDKIFLAKDTEEKHKIMIINMAEENHVFVEIVESMLQLGRACAVPRKTAVAAILKKEEKIDK